MESTVRRERYIISMSFNWSWRFQLLLQSNRSQPAIGLKQTPKARVSFSTGSAEGVLLFAACEWNSNRAVRGNDPGGARGFELVSRSSLEVRLMPTDRVPRTFGQTTFPTPSTSPPSASSASSREVEIGEPTPFPSLFPVLSRLLFNLHACIYLRGAANREIGRDRTGRTYNFTTLVSRRSSRRRFSLAHANEYRKNKRLSASPRCLLAIYRRGIANAWIEIPINTYVFSGIRDGR